MYEECRHIQPESQFQNVIDDNFMGCPILFYIYDSDPSTIIMPCKFCSMYG